MKKIHLDLELLKSLHDRDIQQREIARRLGVNRSTIERNLRALGLYAKRTGPKSGERHPGWRGGRRNVAGYWYIYFPNHPFATKGHAVAEHRLIMEDILKRYVLPHEVVHHKDGNPTNNDPDNLALFRSNADHLRHELTGRVPKWTHDGIQRIKAGIRKAAAKRRAQKRNRNG